MELVNLIARRFVTQNKLGCSLWKLFGQGQALSKKYLVGDWMNQLSITFYQGLYLDQISSRVLPQVRSIGKIKLLLKTIKRKTSLKKKSLQCHSSLFLHWRICSTSNITDALSLTITSWGAAIAVVKWTVTSATFAQSSHLNHAPSCK